MSDGASAAGSMGSELAELAEPALTLAGVQERLAVARARVERLRATGRVPAELDGRLVAAEILVSREQFRPAALLVYEVLVLAKTMARHGVPEAADEDLVALKARVERTRAELLERVQQVEQATASLEDDVCKAVEELLQRIAGADKAADAARNATAQAGDVVRGAIAGAKGELLEQVEQKIRDAVDRFRAEVAERLAAASNRVAPEIESPFNEKNFMALAREVKSLKELVLASGPEAVVASPQFKLALEGALNAALTQQVEALRGTLPSRYGPDPAAGRGGGGLPDIRGLMNTAEFKEMFDSRVKQMLSYLKADVIPQAVKKALEEK